MTNHIPQSEQSTEAAVTNWTPERLIAFRDKVADAFRSKRILSPVHFPSDTQAEPLVSIFKDFREGDWLFSGWRSMWHVLLAGMPEDELFQMILDGRSMYIQDRARRVFCSSIVGGILPIALGVAWSLKRQRDKLQAEAAAGEVDGPRVWVCAGDMTATTGLFWEFLRYSRGHDLPVVMVIENNRLSTNAVTEVTWGNVQAKIKFGNNATLRPPVHEYFYERTHPHVALAERVSF